MVALTERQAEAADRLTKVTVALTRSIQQQELSQKIQSDVQETINQTQREYFLREQMRAIKKELGEDNDQLELDEMRTTWDLEPTKLPEPNLAKQLLNSDT